MSVASAGVVMSALRLEVFEEPCAFLDAAMPLLSRDEAGGSMIVVPAGRIASGASPLNPADEAPYMAAVFERGEPLMVALHMAWGGVLLAGDSTRAAALVAEDMGRRGRHPPSVVGAEAPGRAFADAWRENTGIEPTLRFRLRHMALHGAPAPIVAPGTMRRATEDEFDTLVAWQVAFIAESGVPDDPERVRRLLRMRQDRGGLRVWDDGGMASYAGFGEHDDIGRIAPVYTPPERRRRGYASALVAALSAELLASGKRALFLTTDLANPTSNGIYERIGFRSAADHVHIDLRDPGEASPS
jgi:predicted GNAT family acetyltransferase